MRTKRDLFAGAVLGPAAGCGLLVPWPCAATDRTWTGGSGVDNNWMTPGNWQGGIAPSPGDNLIFQGVTSAGNSTNHNNFPSGTMFGKLTIATASGQDFSLGGNRVVLTNGIAESAGGIGINALAGFVYFDLTLGTNESFTDGTSLASILFSDTNYALYGNSLNITEGITNQPEGGTNFFYPDLNTTDPLVIDVESGGALVLNDAFAGSGTISKEDGGMLIYSGTTMNSFIGNVAVNNGTCRVDGSFTDGSFAISGGLLEGTGTVSSVTMSGGTLKPGDSPGIFHIQGDLTMSAGAVFQTELNGAFPGSGYGQLQVNGGVNLNGASLNLVPGYSITPGTAFLIVVNGGTDPVSGTFAGLPEGAVFSAGGQYFSISYKTGSGGNDIAVTAVNLPPNLTQIAPLNPGVMQLQGIGGSNATYTILANTNLATTNWLDIGTAPANGSGVFLFNDSNVMSFPQRFYRTRSR